MRRALAVLALCRAYAPLCASAGEATDAARARQVASVLGVEAQIEAVASTGPPVTLEDGIAHLSAIEDAVVALSRAGLEVDATGARLQDEQHAAKNAHDIIESRYESSVERWSIAAVLVGNGVSIVGVGMQFGNDNVARWGDGVAIAGAALATAFSIVALVKHDVDALPLSIETNLLAQLLGCAPTPASRYPDWIWRYLDEPLAGASRSIRRELIDKWVHEGHIPSGEPSPADERIGRLCRPLRRARRIDADYLDDRADMLADVRARLAALSVDLELLWRQLHARR